MQDHHASDPDNHLAEMDELLADDRRLPQTRISRVIDGMIIGLGRLLSWLWLVVVLLIMWIVVSRYAFASSAIALDEMQWHLASVAWLFGLSYTLAVNEHVRVDLLYDHFSLRKRCWVEFFGITCLLLPFLAIAIREAIPFATESFRIGERSSAPAGLSGRWILKALMGVSLALLFAAAISRLLRVCACLFGFPRPVARPIARDDKRGS